MEEFQEEQERAEREKREGIRAERKAEERSMGMRAAKAKLPGSRKPLGGEDSLLTGHASSQQSGRPTGIQHDVAIDGKVVKSTYNACARARFVHVTEIRLARNGDRSHFIIGSRATDWIETGNGMRR